MKSRIWLALVVTAAVGLSACGKSEEPEEPKAPETGAVEEKKTMVEKAAEVAEEGAEKVSEMSTAAMEKGAEMADAAVAKAEELIQQAKDYIDTKEFDLAEQVMEQLRKLRDSLPESLQAQIDQLETLISSTTSAPASQGQ
jgi:acyl-CoA reductase-like NAD-dependent aldehyde dehydrogenase